MQEKPTAPQRQFQRRQLLVDGPFQWSLIWRTMALSCFVQIAVLIGLVLPLVRGMNDPTSDRVLAVDAAIVLLHIHENAWWILLVCLLLPGLVALKLSHRIAGPLVRVKRMLRQLGDGRLPAPLHTRTRDLLKPEVALLNEAVAHLGEHIEHVRAAHDQLLQALAATKQRADALYDPGMNRCLKQAATAAAAVGASLARFQPLETPRPDAAAAAPASEPALTP